MQGSWREVDRVAGCDAVFAPEVNVVIWRRSLDPELECLLDAGIHPVGSWRQVLAMDADERLRPGSAVDRLPGPWRSEIANLAELLCLLTGGTDLGLRWDIATRATCPRFHYDRTTLRLVCTYRGPGTEWVDERDVDRPIEITAEPGHRWPELVREGRRIHGAQPGDVVLLKGDRWPDNAGRGAVHRSPPVPSGLSRLLLTLDVL